MKIRNVKLPEGINVSRHSPVADLLILSAGAVMLFLALGAAALFAGAALGRHMPVEWENALVSGVLGGEAAEADVPGSPEQAALQDLADRLLRHMDIPDGLEITVHYLESDEVNAFATLGGHIFVFRGLLSRMPDENALAMVLAHEIAHAANRDPAAALGGTLLLRLILSAVSSSSAESLDDLIDGPNALLVLSFGRDAERQADGDALRAIAREYGHVAGAATIFEVFLEEVRGNPLGEPPELLNTHPLSQDRIDALRALARDKEWQSEGETAPLPDALAALRGQ